jgi:hypothetical protein
MVNKKISIHSFETPSGIKVEYARVLVLTQTGGKGQSVPLRFLSSVEIEEARKNTN